MPNDTLINRLALSKKPLSLVDANAPLRNEEARDGRTVLDLPDLKRRTVQSDDTRKTPDTAVIIDGLVHAVQNNLQTISLGLDLMAVTEKRSSVEWQPITQGIEQASRLLREVQEYFSPPEIHPTTESLAAVVEKVVWHVATEWSQQGVCVRKVYREPLLSVKLDWLQFGKALERVLSFSYALLSHGGELTVETGLRQLRHQHHVELQVAISSPAPLAVKQKEVFHPFLLVNNYPVGLSLILAHRMLRCHRGTLSFHKDGARQGTLTMRIKL